MARGGLSMVDEMSLSDQAIRRRQRVRNVVLLLVLLGLACLFYAIALVKFRVQ